MDPDFDYDDLIAEYQDFDDGPLPPPPHGGNHGAAAGLLDADDEWVEQRLLEVDARPLGAAGEPQQQQDSRGGSDPVTRRANLPSPRPWLDDDDHHDGGVLDNANDHGARRGDDDDDHLRTLNQTGSRKDDGGADDDADDDRAKSDVYPCGPNQRLRKKHPAVGFESYADGSAWRRDDTADSPTAATRATKWKASSAAPASPRGRLFPNPGSRAAAGSQAGGYPSSSNFSLSSAGKDKPETVRLYRSYHPKPGDSSVTFTCRNGERLYVRVQKEVDGGTSSESRSRRTASSSSSSSNSSLLGVPMAELMRRVHHNRRKQEHERASWRAAATAAKTDEDDPAVVPSPSAVVSPSPGRKKKERQEDGRMWVDKYAPSSFAHLLSDERTNRDVVRALRAWDPYVFRRDAPPPPPPPFASWRPDFGTAQTSQGGEDGSRKPFRKFGAAPPNANPKDNRPDAANRVILLSGAPGVGKSTLAHILARHAGYDAVEVNGSDDRSAQVLRERVAALESNRIDFHYRERRPCCLILDEIDGADARGAIQALVEIVRADIPPKSARKKAVYLRRPLILICNNKFAPALRPILPYCRHFILGSPSSTRLVTRLQACLQQEGLVVSGPSVLHQLGAAACGDIRSCLHTLQFVASRARQQGRPAPISSDGGRRNVSSPRSGAERKQVDVSQAILESLSGGQKDIRNDVASTVTAVFRKEKTRSTGSIASSSVGRLLQAIEAFGDNSRILDCVFINVLNVSYIDPTMEKCYAAHEWLSEADLYRNGLESYIPPAAGAVHLLCRVEQRPDLTFTTRTMSDAHYSQESNQALLHRFAEGLSPNALITRGNGSTGLALEIVPYTLWILSAGDGSGALDRPVTSCELLSKGEMESFQKHVDTLKALGLSYRVSAEEKSSRHHSVPCLQLEPPIDRVAKYEGLILSRERSRREISPSIKELLAQRVVHESLRNSSPKKSTVKNDTDHENAEAPLTKGPGSLLLPRKRDEPKESTRDEAATSSLPPAKRSKPATPSKPTAQNFLQIRAKRAKESKSARNAARVGFIRAQAEKLSHTGSGVPLSQVLRLKYVKGFTEAVRKPCNLEDLR